MAEANGGRAMTLKEMIAVMQAADEGKVIQSTLKGGDSWADCPGPRWNWNGCDYRVKPEQIEGWINVYPRATSPLYASMAEADSVALSDRLRCVHVREVKE